MNTKRLRAIIAILLIISIGNYLFIIYNGTVRTVEFVSIFAIGALAGLLLAVVVWGGQIRSNGR